MANLSGIREKLHGSEIEEQKVITEYSTLEELYGAGFKNEYQAHIQESVDNVLKNSKNLVYALEGIGAMYCIPAGHIMRNDDIGSIKITGDNIIAPGNVNAINNKQAVVRAIAALLDKKSMGIDDKLDAHHKHHCHELFKQEPQFTPDPGKGTVVGRYLDDEDNEILVYNTGMVDCKTCPTTMKKIDELRKDGLIPPYNAELVQGSGVENPVANYFADMDDITAGVDMQSATTSNTTTGEDSVTGMESTDIAAEIDEDEILVEAYSLFGDTRHLGYDIMKLQGFDFVKPTTDVITESETIVGRKNRKRVAPSEFKYMRFDNKHIINAVGWINDWIEDNTTGTNIKAIDFDKLYQSREFKKAIDELSEQFDARIIVHYNNDPNAYNVYTTIDYDHWIQLNDITISKSKGFQFNNNQIDLYLDGPDPIKDWNIDRIDLVGQGIVSILLHEIFHNAMFAWRVSDIEFEATLTLSLQLALTQKNVRKRRKIIENYVNYIDNFYGYKLNAISRKVLVKRLTIATGIATQQPGFLKRIKDGLKKAFAKKTIDDAKTTDETPKPDKDMLETIEVYDKYMKEYEKRLNNKGGAIARAIIGTIAAIAGLGGMKANTLEDEHMFRTKGITVFYLISSLTALVGGFNALAGLGSLLEASLVRAMREAYAEDRDLEEQWCDMFAAMYKLPPAFKYETHSGNNYTDDKVSAGVVQQFNQIDIAFHKFIMDPHPSDTERNYQSVKIAAELLKQKKYLDPEVVRYLEWLVEAFKNTGANTEIENIYNTSVFDLTEAENLDKHLEHLATVTNSTLVEFTAYDINDWNVISE